VYALADAIDQRYRALVLLGTFGSLRWGELAALRRGDIDLEACTVRVDGSSPRPLAALLPSGRPSRTRASAWCRSPM
jgi:integrase